MADQTLFNEQQQDNQEQQKADQPASLFKIGDREYDVESAKTKIENADQFIETLKSEKLDLAAQLEAFKKENTELAEKIAKSSKIEEALSMFQHQQNIETQQNVETHGATTSIDVEALKAELLKEAQQTALSSIQNLERQKLESQNISISLEAAKLAYGDQMAEKLVNRGKELGLDSKAIDQMAKTNPSLFQEIFIPKQVGSHQVPGGSGNTHHGGKPSPSLENVIEDWGDKSKFWSSSSKVDSLRKMQEEVETLLKAGKIEPNAKRYF